mmetsp:Transcript_29018/g.70769  ORF Transcript_29018/g.70769 Transcript_29018/m.70769 type:complete len:746 (-) Transcript_29018:121-2358(-)|eukprot:CAMPEP_0114512814 /NCGR_PEP_ID=MMETSP0109-20121206/15196_1 /TAXON_ID=29199 /ORGANISM="Chlorarachnion reptans, Strain CCCM449" /LENGTH=745 /DNA_ID=CAMNT_0001692563 /DNA_START=1285 /DNA_END=3522 /DNA_ORIENTATION=-
MDGKEEGGGRGVRYPEDDFVHYYHESMEEGLTEQQQQILRVILGGSSAFFTGAAGSGKSFLLNRIIDVLPSHGTFVTASTGRAAVQLGGITLHSFAGIGLGLRNGVSVHDLLRRARRPETAHRWRSANVLIIDEISMIDAETFDALELIAREVREDSRPFGGIQLVLTGDFLQLPPVLKFGSHQLFGVVGDPKSCGHDGSLELETLSTTEPLWRRTLLEEDGHHGVGYAFQAASWNRAVPVAMQLNDNVRAKSDPILTRILEEVRYGYVSDFAHRTLVELSSKSQIESNQEDDDIEFTRVFATRAEVAAHNVTKLAAIEGRPRCFRCKDVDIEEGHPNLQRLLDTCPVPDSMTLKVGAQVLLVRNMSHENGLVNGSRGVVTRFERFCLPETEKKKAKNQRSRKARMRQAGRKRNMEKAWGESEEEYWPEICPDEEFPVVRFCNGVETVIRPGEWSITDIIDRKQATLSERPQVVFTRHQLPLVLGWAMTIHRCQGMTIDRAEISLSGTFEAGQAYVALSRVRSLEHLRLLNYERAIIRADPVAVEFHLSVQNAAEEEQRTSNQIFRDSELYKAVPVQMPETKNKIINIPSLVATIIPKPSKDELKRNNEVDLLHRLYSKRGRSRKHSVNLRQAITQYDPDAFEKHWERLKSGEYSRRSVLKFGEIDEYKILEEKAGLNLPKKIKVTSQVQNFLRKVVEQKTKGSATSNRSSHSTRDHKFSGRQSLVQQTIQTVARFVQSFARKFR